MGWSCSADAARTLEALEFYSRGAGFDTSNNVAVDAFFERSQEERDDGAVTGEVFDVTASRKVGVGHIDGNGRIVSMPRLSMRAFLACLGKNPRWGKVVAANNRTLPTLEELPRFEFARFNEDGTHNPPTTDLPRWSGAAPPPPIGDTVNVRLNGLGFSRVEGYFVEDGWLGVVIKPANPPDWFVRQKGAGASGHVFGIEINAASSNAATKLPASRPRG